MKKLEDLNIQPTPWNVDDDGCVIDANGEFVTGYTPAMDRMDTSSRLLAFAPKLYKALYESIVEVCQYCPSCGSCVRGYACHRKKGTCSVQKLRKVLDEASGAKRGNTETNNNNANKTSNKQ